MRAPNWHTNPDYASRPPTEIGDIIHLKFRDTYEYVAKAVVQSIGKRVTATVEGIYDAQDRAFITSGDVLQLVGKQIDCEPKYIHKLIKHPQGS